MKTIKLIALLPLFYLSLQKIAAQEAARSSTFVNPCQPFASINPIVNTYGCFSFSATNAGNIDPNAYYSWDFGDGTTGTGTYVYHCFQPVTATTVFTITVAYNSPALCGPLPTTLDYTLALSPPSQTPCIISAPSMTLSASSVTLWVGITFAEIIHEFNYGDGTAAVKNPTHQYAHCGNYIIEEKTWDMNVPQSFCYSYQAVNIACPVTVTTTTGILERVVDEISLFPNPASAMLTVRSGKQINGIKVVDITGREWRAIRADDSRESFSVSELPVGVYLVKLNYENGSQQICKFIRE
jgi:hypothetical protein